MCIMKKEMMMTKNFYIYGAGIVATGIYTAVKALYGYRPKAFLVSNMEGNVSEIDEIPVKTALQIRRFDCTDKILIAVPEVHHKIIADSLYKYNISRKQLIFVDNRLENRIMEKYYSRLPEFTTAQELMGKAIKHENNQEQNITVFQAKCHVDKPLQSKVEIPEYIVPIQVGTVYTDRKIAEIQDNIGENISEKNPNYCELTATYYAWKNSKAAYKGLCHYRRIFDITEQQMQQLLENQQDWDAVLPYPTVHYPNISGQHTRYLSEDDWQALLQALRDVAPEYLAAYEMAVASGEQYFLNYNMLIAKAEIFDDYCDFLFHVLARAEELAAPKGKERADRFAGYMGENLTTIYFLKNRDRLKIVYTGKLWIT